MKKNKLKELALIILGIALIIFNVIVFALPIVKTSSFWIAYAFTIIAFLLQIFTSIISFGKNDILNTLKSKYLGFSIFYIGFVYLVVQLIVCAIFMAIPSLPAWVPIIVCSVILAISCICLIATDAGKDETNRIDDKVKNKIFYINSLLIDLEILTESAKDNEAKNALRCLSEKIKYSDPMSDNSLAEIEEQIKIKVVDLKTAVSQNKTKSIISLKEDISLLLSERNKKCKILK